LDAGDEKIYEPLQQELDISTKIRTHLSVPRLEMVSSGELHITWHYCYVSLVTESLR